MPEVLGLLGGGVMQSTRGQCRVLGGNAGSHWVLNGTGVQHAVHPVPLIPPVLEGTWRSLGVLCGTEGYCWVLQGTTRYFRVLKGTAEYRGVLQCSTSTLPPSSVQYLQYSTVPGSYLPVPPPPPVYPAVLRSTSQYPTEPRINPQYPALLHSTLQYPAVPPHYLVIINNNF